MTQHQLEQLRDQGILTRRQHQILELRRRGFSHNQIALGLGISPSTSKWITRRALQKIALHKEAA